jgi:hypothetical protein
MTQGQLTNTTVEVAGSSASLGTLEPGETLQITLSPRNHAGGVVFRFALPNGTEKSEVLDSYIESRHFGGRVHVEIREGGEVRVISNTVRPRIWPWLSAMLSGKRQQP